jgi:hypothetical protein
MAESMWVKSWENVGGLVIGLLGSASRVKNAFGLPTL